MQAFRSPSQAQVRAIVQRLRSRPMLLRQVLYVALNVIHCVSRQVATTLDTPA
jgi:hypothetical protein